MTGNAKKGRDGFNVSEAPPGMTRPANPPPAPPTVEYVGARSPEAIRQERRRQRLDAMGVKVVEVELGRAEREMLDKARRARGGLDGPYSVHEYLATLLRRDFALLEQQQGKLAGRICENCRKPLPRGCGGTWAGEAGCLRAQTDKALQL